MHCIPQRFTIHLRLFPDDVEHAVLEGLLVFGKEVLFPRIIAYIRIEVVPLQASHEETSAVLVLGLFFKLEPPAVNHEVIELARHVLAELLQACFQLLILDSKILFIFVSSW